ncbi:glycoside hydrolase [Syncephalis plumigaleata]|nr:glycoside hydrolase [Syncephalis plumigaleata]
MSNTKDNSNHALAMSSHKHNDDNNNNNNTWLLNKYRWGYYLLLSALILPEAEQHARQSLQRDSPNGVHVVWGQNRTTSDDDTNNSSHQHQHHHPWRERQMRVVEATRACWAAYREDAFGKDEYRPMTRDGYNFAQQAGMGYMIIDALDTLYLMRLETEYNEAREWLANNHTFELDVSVSVFETTIRALDLGERLLPAFNTFSGVPYAKVHLTGKPIAGHRYQHEHACIAESGTLQLEFRYLSHLTGDMRFWYAAEGTMAHLLRLPTCDGLLPITISPNGGESVGEELALGARGDSYYEYLLKQWLQTSKTESQYRTAYDQSVQGIRMHLWRRTGGMNDRAIIGDKNEGTFRPRMEHLTCFAGGMLALGATNGRPVSASPQADLRMAEDITETCWRMYTDTESGIAPEAVYYEMISRADTAKQRKSNSYVVKNEAVSYLRPETVESLFILWRITGNSRYREWGWQIFEAFQRHASVPNGRGFATVLDVRVKDHLETFFIAETLKYLYLLFEDDPNILPLDQLVFNTEAHPLPIFMPY